MAGRILALFTFEIFRIKERNLAMVSLCFEVQDYGATDVLTCNIYIYIYIYIYLYIYLSKFQKTVS